MLDIISRVNFSSTSPRVSHIRDALQSSSDMFSKTARKCWSAFCTAENKFPHSSRFFCVSGPSSISLICLFSSLKAHIAWHAERERTVATHLVCFAYRDARTCHGGLAHVGGRDVDVWAKIAVVISDLQPRLVG